MASRSEYKLLICSEIERQNFFVLLTCFKGRCNNLLVKAICVWVGESLCIAPMIVCIAFITENNNSLKEKRIIVD